MPGKALTVTEIEEQLEKYLDPVLSLRRTAAEPAQSLAELHRPLQEFVLHWVSVVVKTNSEMGFQFAAYAARALQLMDREDVEVWLIDAMDTYDKLGLYPGCAAIQDVERYAESVADRKRTVSFEEVAGVLQRFVVGLSGRELTIAAASIASTDTEVLYLPDQISLWYLQSKGRCSQFI